MDVYVKIVEGEDVLQTLAPANSNSSNNSNSSSCSGNDNNNSDNDSGGNDCTKDDASNVKSSQSAYHENNDSSEQRQQDDLAATVADSEGKAVLNRLATQSMQQAQNLLQQRRYRQAIDIYEKLMELGIDPQGCQRNIGCIYLLAKSWHNAIRFLEPIVKSLPRDNALREKLADAYFGAERYADAKKEYVRALEYLRIELIPKNTSDRSLQIQYQNLCIRMGRCIYLEGDRETAFQVYSSVLRQNQKNIEGLIEYALSIFEMQNDLSEPISVTLRVLVALQQAGQGESDMAKRVKQLFSRLLMAPGGIDEFLKQVEIDDPEKFGQAVAWVALIVRDHGGVDETIRLYKIAYERNRNSVSLALSLTHAIELKLDYQKAFDVILDFCSRNKDVSIRDIFSCADFIELMSGVRNLHHPGSFRFDEQAHILDVENFATVDTSKQKSNMTADSESSNGQQQNVKSEYLPEELDLLALFFTGVKILYASGALSILPSLISKLELTRQGHDLHMTSIRNEQAYFSCISQLMSIHASQRSRSAHGTTRPLYVCGDSHCLSPAWQAVTLHGEARYLHPVLVTGMKCWHLRSDFDFYPKINFYNAIETIPHGAEIVFMFGEIDCREGILVAVERCRYQSLEQGMRHTIRIYLRVLRQLAQRHKFKIYVHPVLPMLDLTRTNVFLFNRILDEELQSNENSSIPLIWLGGFEDKLLLQEQKGSGPPKLDPRFELDGTHINPTHYISLLESELNSRTSNTEK